MANLSALKMGGNNAGPMRAALGLATNDDVTFGSLVAGRFNSATLANCFIDLDDIGTGRPGFVFDSTDFIDYNRSTNELKIVIGNADILTASSSAATAHADLHATAKLRVGTTTDTTVFSEQVALKSNSLVESIYRTTNTASFGVVEVYSDVTTTKQKHFEILAGGNVNNTSGTYGTISDQSLKQDIESARSYADDFKSINFRKFRLKNEVAVDPEASAYLGVVAQELEQIFPGLIDHAIDPGWAPYPGLTGAELEAAIANAPKIKTVKQSILHTIAAVVTQELLLRVEALEQVVGVNDE